MCCCWLAWFFITTHNNIVNCIICYCLFYCYILYYWPCFISGLSVHVKAFRHRFYPNCMQTTSNVSKSTFHANAYCTTIGMFFYSKFVCKPRLSLSIPVPFYSKQLENYVIMVSGNSIVYCYLYSSNFISYQSIYYQELIIAKYIESYL